MTGLRHALSAFRLGLGNLVAKPRNTMLIVAGLLIASFTLLVVLTIPAGLQRIAGRTGLADVAVVLPGSGFDETGGNIAPELVQRIGVLPGVAQRPDGSPLVAPQFVVTTKLPRRSGGIGTVLVRGVPAALWDVVDDGVRFTQGAAPRGGATEIAAGAVAARLYPFTQTDATLALGKHSMTRWRISGEFAADGGLWESELWADIDNLRGEFNAPGQTTSIWVRLTTPDAFDTFRKAIASDAQLHGFKVYRQHTVYAGRVAFLSRFAEVASLIVAILLGLMAILAGNSAIGLALRARRRELAMLRVVGFGNGALFAALLAEVLVLAALCALLAAGIAALLLHARAVDSSSGNLSVHFAMAVTPGVIGTTLAYAALLGLVSACLPAWRVLHAPLVGALARE